jgi:hypothetical protein
MGAFSTLVNQIVDVINVAVQALGALALLLFMWSGVHYVRSAGEKDQRQSREAMLWGLIALFILVSIWGILRILRSVLLG